MSRAIGKAENVVAILNGVDTEFFNPGIDVKGVANRYGLEGRAPVMFVRRLAKTKDVGCLIRAANIVEKQFGHGDALFVLTGSRAFDGVDRATGVGTLTI